MKIFGVETEILFQLRPLLIEAQVRLALTIAKLKLEADVHIKAEYGDNPLKDFEFWAKVTLSGHKEKVIDFLYFKLYCFKYTDIKRFNNVFETFAIVFVDAHIRV